MWLYLNDAFVSIVQDRDDPTGNTLLVRARVRGDIERFLAGAGQPPPQVQETRRADYRFRVRVPRQTVACAVADAAQRIGYDNFKASVRGPEPERASRAHAYGRCWQAMRDLQDTLTGREMAASKHLARSTAEHLARPLPEPVPPADPALCDPRTAACAPLTRAEGDSDEG